MASANVGDCLSGAWGTFKKNILTHVVCTLLVMVVAGISAGLLVGPMVVGYMRLIERESRGEAVQIGDVFRGFDDFVPAFVAGLISSLVVSLGFMLCFIPGLLVGIEAANSRRSADRQLLISEEIGRRNLTNDAREHVPAAAEMLQALQ